MVVNANMGNEYELNIYISNCVHARLNASDMANRAAPILYPVLNGSLQFGQRNIPSTPMIQ